MAEQKGRTKMGEEKAGGAARGKAEATPASQRYAGSVRKAVAQDGTLYVALQDLMAYFATLLVIEPELASTASAPKEPPEPTPDPEAQR